MKTTTTFSNDNSTLFLNILTIINTKSEIIFIGIEVIKINGKFKTIIYNGSNLSEAIDIFNTNL